MEPKVRILLIFNKYRCFLVEVKKYKTHILTLIQSLFFPNISNTTAFDSWCLRELQYVFRGGCGPPSVNAKCILITTAVACFKGNTRYRCCPWRLSSSIWAIFFQFNFVLSVAYCYFCLSCVADSVVLNQSWKSRSVVCLGSRARLYFHDKEKTTSQQTKSNFTLCNGDPLIEFISR